MWSNLTFTTNFHSYSGFTSFTESMQLCNTPAVDYFDQCSNETLRYETLANLLLSSMGRKLFVVNSPQGLHKVTR
jgi:hypothetical protein